jgi:naphthalene 1,2-dioxygenase system ferredoxin subunit
MAEALDSNTGWVDTVQRDALQPASMLPAVVEGRDVALYDVDGEVYATDNQCTHALALLTDGLLEGDCVECPLHGGRFSVRDGRGMGAPISCDLTTYPTRVVDGVIQIRLMTSS